MEALLPRSSFDRDARRLDAGRLRFMMNGTGAHACDRWSEVWEVIRPRLRPVMRPCDSASVVGTQVLLDWLQDFALELHNAALDHARYAVLRFSTKAMGRFT